MTLSAVRQDNYGQSRSETSNAVRGAAGSVTPAEVMILVGVPLREETSSQWWLHWLQTAWMPRGVVMLPHVGTLVHDARNRIVREALELSGWQTLVMLDADVFPPPHEECHADALTYVREYGERDLPVVGPLCYGRSMVNPTPVSGYFSGPNHYERLSPELYDQLTSTPDLHRVDVLGMGCVAFQRRVFEDLSPPWFAHPVSHGAVLGEDHHLYRRLKSARVPVLLDTRWHVLHLGSLFYGQQTYRIWRALEVSKNADSERGACTAAATAS